MNRWVKAAKNGALAGTAASTPMGAFMKGANALGLLGEEPPRKITRSMLRAVGLSQVGSAGEKVATVAAHYLFGASVGAVYGVMREGKVMPRGPLAGALFGTAVWAVSYMGWVPALTAMPSPANDRPFRPTIMLSAHWLFGAALDRGFDMNARSD